MIKGIKVERAKEIFEWLSDEYLLPTLKKNVFERLKKTPERRFLNRFGFWQLSRIIGNCC